MSDAPLVSPAEPAVLSAQPPAKQPRDPNALISLILTDGKLDVMAWPLLLDFMTIRSSTVEVTYEPVAVPEPATALLLLTGLAAGQWRRRRTRETPSHSARCRATISAERLT